MDKTTFSLLMGALASYSTLLFGEWSLMTQCFFILMGLDIGTGIIDAIAFHRTKYGKGFSSNGLFQGVIRKALMTVVVVVATQADAFLEIDFLRQVSLGYLCATEAISIVENLIKMGVPVPTILTKLLAEAKEEAENDKQLR